MKRLGKYNIPNWLLALLFIFAFSIIGLGISIFTGFFIPLWLLLAFSILYSVEKWFSYPTRKHKYLGKIYRLILNLCILALLGLLVWSGIKLFSQQFHANTLVGSLIFVAELVLFVWMWRVVSKNSWRWPSMKLTVFSVIILTIIFAFAGVQPVSSYKDDLFEKWDEYQAEQEIKKTEEAAYAEIEEQKRLEEEQANAEQKRIEEELQAQEQKAQEEQARIEEESAQKSQLSELEHEVILLVNLIRTDRGTPMLMWDDTLYEYSKKHSIAMAEKHELFHSPMELSYAENAWGGEGSKHWEAIDIVESWMDSHMHRTWLLCPNLKHVAVGIAYSNNGMYASWTFWRNETAQADWWYQYSPDEPPEWWY